MKKFSRTALIAALSLTVAGIALAAAALISINFDFPELSTDDYEEVERVIEGDFLNISIMTDIHDVNILASEDGICRMVAHESDKVTFEANVDQGTLYITFSDNTEWYDHLGISIGERKLDLYLPEAEYGELKIETATGSVSVPADCHILNAEISSSTGNIDYRAPMTQHILFTNKTGAVNISGIRSCYTLGVESAVGSVTVGDIEKMHAIMNISTTTGSIILSNIKTNGIAATTDTGAVRIDGIDASGGIWVTSDTGNIKLTASLCGPMEIKTETGNVSIEDSDAESILITTATGNVSGTLRSEKVFDVHSDTGNIDVPQSSGDGDCRIITATGNIKIGIN